MAAPCIYSNFVWVLVSFFLYHGCVRVLCNAIPYVSVMLNATQTQPFDVIVSAPQDGGRKLCILCYPGQDTMWHKLWINPKITIKTSDLGTNFDFYYGQNLTEIVSQAESGSFLKWSPYAILKEEHAFEPFSNSCIGITSEKSYTANFVVKNPEKWFVAYTAAGLFLFFLAEPLSRNTFLQYGTGISVGVLGSLLLLVFILSKLLPQKMRTLGYIIAAVSTSASMYLYQWISYYFSDIIKNHWQIFLGYTVIMGLVSFAVVYRYGPIDNQRTLNLVKWILQLLGIVMMYQGTQIAEVSVAIIAVAVITYLFPASLLVWFKKFRNRWFRSKIRLLTEEEYYTEGEVETKKALEELRNFCHSPGCDAWKTISRLSSPNKFASFIEGSFHLTDIELEDHCALHSSNINDDSESDIDMSQTDCES